jgi:hypothetical protein
LPEERALSNSCSSLAFGAAPKVLFLLLILEVRVVLAELGRLAVFADSRFLDLREEEDDTGDGVVLDFGDAAAADFWGALLLLLVTTAPLFASLLELQPIVCAFLLLYTQYHFTTVLQWLVE